MDSAVERVLAGGHWYGAKGRGSAAWRLRYGDGGPLTGTRASDGLTIVITDRCGYLDHSFESDDDAGEAVEWIEDLLSELDAADAIPVGALEGIDLSEIRQLAEGLIPPPPAPGTDDKWRTLRNPRPSSRSERRDRLS